MDGNRGSSRVPDYYAILGVSKEAPFQEIRRAYRKLALRWHPDRCKKKTQTAVGEAKQRFQEIQQAYSVLSDNGKRKMYDVGLLDPYDDEEDPGLSEFMDDLFEMMQKVAHQDEDDFDDLQKMWEEMMGQVEPMDLNMPLDELFNINVEADRTGEKRPRRTNPEENFGKRTTSGVGAPVHVLD